ncbi:MAG: protein kinase [Bryobacteraceae bacterium]|nr:protein kinase [Bryobacteraceae bacterium]
MGERAGHYELLAAVATGGAGVVYRGRDLRSGATVAVKILRATEAQDADLRHRFLREGRAMQRLSHPNVVRFIDTGETADGLPFLVTEFVEGDTLRSLMQHGPIPPVPALKATLQIAEALQAAHAVGIVHRDVKPENFMVTHDGTVKMLDFGLSRIRLGTSQSRETKAGTILGSVHYLSPEQARGDAVDERTDIWSVGVVLYEMLTAHLPFHENSCIDTLLAIVEKQAPVLSEKQFSREVTALVAVCLQKRPGGRYQSAADLRAAVESALAEPALAGPAWKRILQRFTT